MKKEEKQKLIDFKNWINKTHVGLYIKISDYEVSKYVKELTKTK